MTDLRQAAQQALEALDDDRYLYKYPHVIAAITALRTALAQPEQEPVAWLKEDWTGGHLNYESVYEEAFAAFPVYKHPPAAQRKWVGLEPEEILDLFDRNNVYGSKWIEFARTVEAKLKAKNDH
jgi:hypothetical protein